MLKVKGKLHQGTVKILTAHLRACGESYFQHLAIAIPIGIRLILAGTACLIHSIFPFVFTTTASDTVKKINAMIELRKGRNDIES